MFAKVTLQGEMGSFAKAHGLDEEKEMVVELDALEALYPGDLRRILVEYITRYYDVTLAERESKRQQAIKKRLTGIQDSIYDSHLAQLDPLEEEYQQKMQEIEEWIDVY